MKKYTFEDWLEGRSINWPLVLLKQNNFTPEQKEVRKQVEEAQKEAWNWMIELTVAFHKDRLDKKSEEYIEAYTAKVKKFIKDHPDLALSYEDNFYIKVGPERYKQLKKRYRNLQEGKTKGWLCKAQTDDPERSKLFDFYVYKELLNYLENRPDPRIQYHSPNYWDTAFKIYRESRIDGKKGLIWEDVYDLIIEDMNYLGLEIKHTTYGSFETARKKYQREQSSSN